MGWAGPKTGQTCLTPTHSRISYCPASRATASAGETVFVTYLAVPIMVCDSESALTAATKARQSGADLVEYRVDRLADDHAAVVDLLNRSPLPCVLTCRSRSEGGEFDGTDAQRIGLIHQVAQATQLPAYLDVELDSYQRSAALRQAIDALVTAPDRDQPRPGLILSTHDFQSRPKDLLRRIETIAKVPSCRVLKVAWMARSLRDNLEVFEIIQRRVKPTIALCMGEFGLASRVLARKFGAMLTFASLSNEGGTAPGQPTVSDLKQLYRWNTIDQNTRIFGVIGYPVAHSMSPPIHNAGFAATSQNAIYLPMPIPPEYEHFKATVGCWLDDKSLDFSGASVTIPHKQNLLRFVAESGGTVEPLAQTIGAANTLVRRANGELFACNTDYSAALDSVCDALNTTRPQLAGRRVAVIGAGGAARAIVAGFAHCGATVVVYNRTRTKADNLAHQFNVPPAKVIGAPLEKLCDSCCEVVINCTPIGMHPHVDQTPMPNQSPLRPDTIVFDTIYNPVQTRLLTAAQQAGCVTIPGTEMFVRQGAAQFQLWTGQPAPLDLFRRVLQQYLE